MKLFPELLSDLQNKMVLTAFEYVEKQKEVEKIYIYCAYENMYSFDVFYKINNGYAQIHKLNEHSKYGKYDISPDHQGVLLDAGIKYWTEVHKLYQACGEKMPTEMKMYYDVGKDDLRSEYKYEIVYSNAKDFSVSPNDIFDEWYEKIKKEEERT